MTDSKILLKYKNEPEYNQAVISKIISYYIVIREQLLNLERTPPLYGLAVLDKHTIQYDKEDLKRIGKPDNFRHFVYQESIKRAIYHFIKNQLQLNNLNQRLKNTKYKLQEKTALNKTLKQFVINGICKTNEEVKNIAYEHYNKCYTDKKDINKNSLADDIMVVNNYVLYFDINNRWNADEISYLSDNLPDTDNT